MNAEQSKLFEKNSPVQAIERTRGPFVPIEKNSTKIETIEIIRVPAPAK